MSGKVGFLCRQQMIDDYARLSGRDLTHRKFFVVLGYFKLAIILEGIHRRYTMGRTIRDGFDRLGAEVPMLIEMAFDAVRPGLRPGTR